MKYTQVPADTFKNIQLNAGVLLSSFDPETGTLSVAAIIGATSGGTNFTATPEFTDYGEDIDNVPKNTMELKRIDSIEAKMSGTFVAASVELVGLLTGASDLSGIKVTPRNDLTTEDFNTIWWVGDYSDANTGDGAGFIAIELINALSTGGFQIQSGDKNKGQFQFEFTGHYSIEDVDKVPYNIYVKQGEVPDATLSALSIGSLPLSPAFDKDVTSYTATTSNATNAITATASDESATVIIKVGVTAMASGASATWADGENTVTITVTNGVERKVYTVIVTKEGE